MSDNENEIQDKGLTAPRVTPADMEAEIAAELFFTAGQAARGLNLPSHESADLLTICNALRNGFTVTGESACASPENYNVELGQKIARQKATEKLWPLLGFRLRDKLAA